MSGRASDRFHELYTTGPGCWEWTSTRFRNGYGRIRVEHNGVKTEYAHRAALMLTGVDVTGFVVRHDCDNPPCVRPSHLRLGTDADNARDAVERGRLMRGESHYGRLLSDAMVVEIRARYAAGESQSVLSREFGVVGTTIHSVVHGRTWSHIPFNDPPRPIAPPREKATRRRATPRQDMA